MKRAEISEKTEGITESQNWGTWK